MSQQQTAMAAALQLGVATAYPLTTAPPEAPTGNEDVTLNLNEDDEEFDLPDASSELESSEDFSLAVLS